MCDVCDKSEMIGVFASHVGPASWGLCQECYNRAGETLGTFEYLYEDVSEKGEGLAEWVNHLSTWKDGKYITWQEYVQERKGLPT